MLSLFLLIFDEERVKYKTCDFSYLIDKEDFLKSVNKINTF